MQPATELIFPRDPEEFYRLRDDRTNHCVSTRNYQSVSTVVSIDWAVAGTVSGQAMMLTACNLLSRWCRRIELVWPAAHAGTPSHFGSGLLKDVIVETMYDADPFGDFRTSDRVTPNEPISLHIGPVPSKISPIVTIDAGGWTASVGPSNAPIPAELRDSNIIGAVSAACFGVANVFKRAIGAPEDSLIADGLFDLFRLERRRPQSSIVHGGPRLSRLDFGTILVVGLGSVGSSFAYCTKLSQAACRAMLVDKDVIKIENFNRSPVFGRRNFALNKAEAVSQALKGSASTVRVFPGTWNEFIQGYGRPSEYDIWLPLANEHGVRESMHSNVPPLLVHAATNQNWGANHGRHIAGVDDCLLDRFPSKSPQALTCSTGEISLPAHTVDAALPFLSVFAGLLVFAELVRLQVPGYPQVPNYACVDFGGTLNQIQKWNCAPRPECPCRKLSPFLYKLFNRTGKHFGLAFSQHG